MNYEKQLKEALSNVNTPYVVASWIEENFPEIIESEDERIRKSISNYINATLDDNESVEKEKWLGWLEKQGEKKSSDEVLKIRQEVYQSGYNDGYKHGCADTIGEQKPINCADDDDKVKSKFKAGDWIIDIQDGEILHINKVRDYAYYVTNLDGASFDTPRCSIETWNRLWTIQDAKAGDVLFQDFMGGKTFIYNGVNPDMAILYSFIISNDGEDVMPYHIGKPNTGIGNIEDNKNIIHPATREQRELLFQKMKVAGYKWDADRKELEVEPKFKVDDIIYEWDDDKKVLKTKPKFKVDDFIKHNKANIICKVIAVNSSDNSYCVENIGIGGSRIELSNAEQNFHLWTIKDAKDGDVLVSVDDKRPFIYKGCLDPNHPDSPVAYCGIDCLGYFCKGGGGVEFNHNHWWTESKVQPATKEQCDLLFSKMKESGYEWDADKKELKAEPKFKVGDWIVQNGLGKYKIIEVCESWYEVISYSDGIQYSIGFDKEDDCHLWTIKDTKDGDVLQLGNVTAIFKEFIGSERCRCYCSVCEEEFEIPSDDDNDYGCYNATPATKEQRDLLFQKMKEAGYEWEAEKKELKKIEQKPACSKDDESKIESICRLLKTRFDRDTCDEVGFTRDKMCDYLIGLKNRIQPQWKPSEEQLNALDEVYKTHGANGTCRRVIFGLLNDLKIINQI